MIKLIQKRHPLPSWIVIQEVGNATGTRVSRHADAVAIGLWPSHGHAIHGFEIKASRSDLLKEFSDPSKADAVGKFCDYWWLVVEDLKIIDTVVVPDNWGILYPKSNVLRVHRKAPKREATQVSRGFSAAMIRKVCETWVPKHEHEEYKRTAAEKAMVEARQSLKYEKSDAEFEIKQLQSRVEEFERASGVAIATGPAWEVGELGAAVKIVLEARSVSGARHRGIHDEAEHMVGTEIMALERSIARHELLIGNLRHSRDRLDIVRKSFGEPEKPAPVQLSLVDDETGR